MNDVVALAQNATGPFVVVVHPSVPVTGVRDLLALARAKPGALNFASTGTGGITHLATELFKMTAKVDMAHIGNAEINRVLRLPEIRERFSSVGLEPQGGTPDEFARLLRSEVDRWAKVVKAAGVKAE